VRADALDAAGRRDARSINIAAGALVGVVGPF
jgi:hypothetical protein